MRSTASAALAAAFAAVGLHGCVTTQAPAIAHVHIGHATEGWADTPGKQGLLVIAEKDANVAAEQARIALENGGDLQALKVHVASAGHALDPGAFPEGAGSGYGFLKALAGAKDHILYAAESNDASENVKTSAPVWAEQVSEVLEQGQLASALALEISQTPSASDAALLAEELSAITLQLRDGEDLDASGLIGDGPGEIGMRQLRAELEATIDREDPPYQPVARKYLFGLVRLPSGEWGFQTSNSGTGGYGYGNYGY